MNEPGINDYLITIIDAIGAVQAAFVALALLYLPGRHKGANRILALLMTVFGVLLGYDVLYQNDVALRFPHLIFAHLPLVFLYGPAFWLYLTRITSVPMENATRESVHFIPFTIAVLCYAPSVLLSGEELLQAIAYAEAPRRLSPDFEPGALQSWLLHITLTWRMPLVALQLLAYLACGWRRLSRHRARVRQQFSYTEKISLDWVRNLMLMVVSMWLLMLLKEFVFGGIVAVWINDLLVIEQVLFVFLLGLYGLLQVPIFDKQEPLPPAPEETAAVKYQSSTLQAAQMEEGLSRLLALMESERPYLNSELTIADLAASLAVPARHLSQIINGALGKNFLDFVNGYRVEAARRHLDDAQSAMSVLDIAMEVGFNSKSAFYNAFKRHLQMTPTQYRRSRAAAAIAAPLQQPGN